MVHSHGTLTEVTHAAQHVLLCLLGSPFSPLTSSALLSSAVLSSAVLSSAMRCACVCVQILKSLEHSFLRHLQQPCHLQQLQFLTTDRSLDIRTLAIELLGKLGDKNPAMVLPLLRQVRRMP